MPTETITMLEVPFAVREVPTQQELAASLKSNGYCQIAAADLFTAESARDLLGELTARAQSFAASPRTAAAVEAFRKGEQRETLKQFLVKYQERQEFSPDDCLLLLGQRSEMQSIIEAATGQPMELISADIWYIPPDASAKPREWSQNWHRDPEAEPIVKAMLYVTDVDDDAGPLEYVAGSHQDKYGDLCPPGRYAANQDDVDAKVPAEERRRFVVPAGTLVMVNTAGMHRGGHTKSQGRLSAIWTYTPVKAACVKKFTVNESLNHDGTIPQNRIATHFTGRHGTNGQAVATKRIAILGKAPASMMLAPFDDPAWEIWAISDCFKTIPRWTRYFELHEVDSRKRRWGEYWDWLRKDHGKPIYVREAHPDLPYCTPYPKREIVERFGTYFTNQISWLIALAIHDGATDIGLYGVDMAQHGDGVKSEYAHQRPSCEYLLGIAVGAGIRVTVNEKSDLLKTRILYGFDQETNAFRLKWKARFDELTEQVKDVNAKLNEAVKHQHAITGVLNDMEWCRQFCTAVEAYAAWTTRLKTVQSDQVKINEQIDLLVKRQHVLLGALDDMHWTRQWCEQ